MLMPASGPMPGSMPTRVPTRHPRNAYQSMLGCSATEKPRIRLWRVSNSEPEEARLERRAQRLAEKPVGEERKARAVRRGDQRIAALHDYQQEEHQQCHRDEEAERLVSGDRGRGDHDDHQCMVAVA